MKRATPLSILGLAIIVAVFVLARSRRKSEQPTPPPPPVQIATTTNESVATNALTASPQPVPPPRKMPVGWEHFLTLKPGEQLNRVTAAMENHALSADVLAFFEKELFNRQHWDVTRNNMANALVWQESPNPRLHECFAKMLADESESPIWRDYCLQFLSECLASSSDPDAIQALLIRYAQGKDGLAGTAIVNVGLQEAVGRMKPDETFSQQLEAQLADPEVVTPTKLSILAMIGKRNDVRLLPLVRVYATNTTDSLRRCAIATLGQIGAPSDLPLIRAGLIDPNRSVQMAADAALKAMDRRK
jgi:hypothetical protein